MKRQFLTSVAGTMVLFWGTLLSTNSQAAPKQLNAIRANVNGEVITQVDLDEAVKSQIPVLFREKGIKSSAEAAREISKLETQALNDLIDRKLLLSEFKAKGFKIEDKHIDGAVNDFIRRSYDGDRDKFMDSLAKQGMSLNQFRKIQEEQIAVRALQSQFTNRPGDSFILPHERRQIYEEIKGEYRGEGTMRIQIITIPKLKPLRTKEQQRDLAVRLQKRIAGGERFSTIAKDYSADQFAKSGGFFTSPDGKRDIVVSQVLSPNLSSAAARLGIERVSQVIDDGLAWRLVLVNSRKSGSIPSQQELETVIENRLTARKRKSNMDGFLKKLRRDANIRIFN